MGLLRKLLVALGLCEPERRVELRSVLHELAHLTYHAVHHDPNSTPRLQQLRLQ